MTCRIMLLNVLKLRRVVEGRNVPVELTHPFMQCWITRADLPEIALEVLVVDGVEADNGCVEADISFGDVAAKIVRRSTLGDVGFGAIKRLE